MKKIETYTTEEAEVLIKYYSDKVINILLDKENGLRITGFETEKTKNGRVELKCNGYSINTSIEFIASIKTVAETLNLQLPQDVLKR